LAFYVYFGVRHIHLRVTNTYRMSPLHNKELTCNNQSAASESKQPA
jgi:hypothetical protein